MEEHQRRGAGHREDAERDGQPDRQRRRRDQHRGQEQKRKRVLQPAGEKQQRRQFDDIERQQGRRIARLQPLHRIEGDLQRQIEQRGQADDGEAGNHRDVEFEPLRHDEDGGELAEHGEPAQPQDGIQTDMAARMAKIGFCEVGHGGSLAVRGPDYKLARPATICTSSHLYLCMGLFSIFGWREHGVGLRQKRQWPNERPAWRITAQSRPNRPPPVRACRQRSTSRIW